MAKQWPQMTAPLTGEQHLPSLSFDFRYCFVVQGKYFLNLFPSLIVKPCLKDSIRHMMILRNNQSDCLRVGLGK